MYPPPCSLSFLLTIQNNVFHSHKSLDSLFKTVNEELSLVADWFCANRLTLNLEKTNFIIFKSHRKSMPLANQMSLVINGVPATGYYHHISRGICRPTFDLERTHKKYMK